MFNKDKSPFRKKSLERLSSPEKLDQLMVVMGPKGWWWVYTLGSFILAVVIWSIFGRIPITVVGEGILVYSDRILPIQTLGSGKVKKLKVKNGEEVTEGQIIAIIEQADLQKQLETTLNKLEDLKSDFSKEYNLLQKQTDDNLKQLEIQRQNYLEQIQQNQTFNELIKKQNLTASEKQLEGYLEQLEQKKLLRVNLEQTLKKRKDLHSQELITDDVLLQAEQEYYDNLDQIATLNSQVEQLKVEQTQTEQQYQANQAKIIELQANLRQLDVQKSQLLYQQKQTVDTKNEEILDTQQSIQRLKEQLASTGQVISPRKGTIISINILPGQIINTGEAVAILQRPPLTNETKKSQSQLDVISYFTPGDGKQIKSGMKMQVTPSIVKREDYGGIISYVNQIVSFPITEEKATIDVGSQTLAQDLTSGGKVIEVRAKMQTNSDNFSGYTWSSGSGPKLTISQGTTASVEVIVEQRAPITFVIPLLRSITGLE